MPCCSSFLSAVFFFFFFFFFHLPRSILSKERDPYYDCYQEFKCGPIKNISYPFFAYSQPDYCGWPSFRLKCENNVTRIIINHQRYSVLDIEPDTQTVKIARNGWKRHWKGNCPTQRYDTGLNYVTLNLSAPFHLSSSPTSNLTLFYNCPLLKTLPTKFQCDTSVTPKDAWISTDANTSHVQPELLKCHDRIAVPLIGTTILDFIHLNSTIEDILKVSFKVKYSVSIRECNECRRSEGQCGYNQTTRKPTCFCGGRVYGLRCPRNYSLTERETTEKGSKKMKNVIIGVGAGAGVLLLACVFFLIRLRRKKHQSKSSALISRSLTPDSSIKPDLERGTSSYFQTPIFSYAELQEATDNFDSSKEIGDGGFGTVYHGTLRDGRVVAVKRLYENNYKRHDQFMNELEILSRLRHRNLVTLYGCTTRHSRELLLVYEYIPNGTVADNLHGDRASTSPLTWPVRLSVAIETADALSYLHASDIIHRDVKTNNILLDHNFHVKVADFGLSRLFPMNATHVSTAPQGTPGYVDPEYYQCYQLNDKSDVYSFGVVLIELISSKPAVDIGRHRHEINLSNMAINKIHNDALHELVDPSLGFESDYSVRRMITMVAELAFRCLQQEKDMRPGMMEVLKCLKDIESAEKVEKAGEVDIPADARLLKNVPPFSPTSVTDKWVSSTTTPNTSG